MVAPKIVSLIPAREESKSIPFKNIVDLNDQPLISYSILDSLRSKLIEETYVSTDSEKIAMIAEQYGAEVPFLRPKIYATDNSTDIEYIKHFLEWFKIYYNYYPSTVVLLRPTTPLRKVEIIDKAIEYFLNNEADSLRSVHKLVESPFKYCFKEEKYLKPIVNLPIKEFFNLPKQIFKEVYKPNGYVDIIKPEVILNTNTVYGEKILAFETEKVIEVDSKEELEYLRYLVSQKSI